MTIRMYKNKLFEEIQRQSGLKGETVTGYVLDSHTGKRTGKAITVDATKVTLTGNDQTCLLISEMSEGELLDFVIGNSDYLSDSYYHMFAEAIHKRHLELRTKTPD